MNRDDTDPRSWATRAQEWAERAKEAENVARSTLTHNARLARRLGRLEGAVLTATRTIPTEAQLDTLRALAEED